MGDKTPMFNAFNINFYRAGLEDADANGTSIQYCTRNHFHGLKRVYSKSVSYLVFNHVMHLMSQFEDYEMM